MTSTLDEIARALDQFCSLVDGDLCRVLAKAEFLVSEARQLLGELDDPAARNAHHHATQALDQIFNARYGFLNQFVRQSNALSTRLREV